MITVTKAMNALKAAGIISTWKWTEFDASYYDDGSKIEKGVQITQERPYILTLDNEVYGKNAVLYFRCSTEANAKHIASILRDTGGKPSFRWCSDQPAYFDMPVGYFKGHKWWE